MSWGLDWGPLADADVRRIHPEPAARLCAAVMLFARTRRGPVTRLSPHDPRQLQLLVAGAVAYLFLDVDAGKVRVQRMFARR
jgi:hypothetical protein